VIARIPPGVADGDRLRIPSKGNAGLHGGAPGDLYITVRVASHTVFRREGDDLHLVVPIAIHEAALGAKIDIRTVDGQAKLRVPPARNQVNASVCASTERRPRGPGSAAI
jgi:molecular chaperone DnaJ